MTSSIILIPGMLKPLRLARVYGFLVEGGTASITRAAVNRHARWNWRGRWLKEAGW